MAKKKNSNSLKALEQQAIKSTESQVKNNKSGTKRIGTKVPKALIIVIILLIILASSCMSGILPWGLKYVECGNAPVITSNFASSNLVEYPGDKNYSPGFFEGYRCMTPAEKDGER